MKPNDLNYDALQPLLRPYKLGGRDESEAFLRWFLEHVYRLEETVADDSVCDGPGDRGIDGVYVDEDASTINVFQCKLRQNKARVIGEAAIRDVIGAATQLATAGGIRDVLESNANDELKKLITRNRLQDIVEQNYNIKAFFVTNAKANEEAHDLAAANSIEIYDRTRITNEFIDVDAGEGINEWAEFDVSDLGYLDFAAGADAKVFIIAASAQELLGLSGLHDGTLFSRNVRLSLGNTKVNKDIASTIANQEEHIKFPLYHNGVTIVCEETIADDDKIKIRGYVVVNGAQSLTVLNQNKSRVSQDLRILVKIVEVGENERLSDEITLRSNNQNSIKPRDLRSNHILQTRLKAEFENIKYDDYKYEIKRGEYLDGNIITNEEAGRLLFASDLGEPWSCHQIYRLFDDRYADIFGRPAVNAWRIILLDKIMGVIREVLPQLENAPFERYNLTRFFILYCISRIFDTDAEGQKILAMPKEYLEDEERLSRFLAGVGEIATGLVLDLKYEVGRDPQFDYKSILKSQGRAEELAGEVVQSYQKDVGRGKIERLSSYV